MINEPEQHALAYSQEVEAMQANQTPDSRETAGHASELIALAHRLHKLEVPAHPRFRSQLAQQLRRRQVGKGLSSRWRRLPALQSPTKGGFALRAAAILVTILVIALFLPAGQSALAAVQDFLRQIRWENTAVTQVAPDNPLDNLEEVREQYAGEEAAGRAWSFSFAGSNFGGCCADGMRNEVVSLDQAFAEAGFPLQLPGLLPDDYALVEVRLLDQPPYQVFAIYEGTDGRLGLHQSRGGIIATQERDANTVSVEARAAHIVTDGPLEEAHIGTMPAALIEGPALVWESDGISFHLIGPGLDVETLIQIAESLQPVN